MKKFIITEDEKKRILNMYNKTLLSESGQTTNQTQQPQKPTGVKIGTVTVRTPNIKNQEQLDNFVRPISADPQRDSGYLFGQGLDLNHFGTPEQRANGYGKMTSILRDVLMYCAITGYNKNVYPDYESLKNDVIRILGGNGVQVGEGWALMDGICNSGSQETKKNCATWKSTFMANYPKILTQRISEIPK